MVVDTLGKIVARFPLTLNDSDTLGNGGEWSVPDNAAHFFRQSKGFWQAKKQDDSFIMIWLRKDDDPNFISFLWRDVPFAFAALEGILRFPLFLGDTGKGLIFDSYSIAWKVIQRKF